MLPGDLFVGLTLGDQLPPAPMQMQPDRRLTVEALPPVGAGADGILDVLLTTCAGVSA